MKRSAGLCYRVLMPWYSKEQSTPFDSTEIPGLEFLHGDVLARHYQQMWVEGKKYPIITFPSGVQREIVSTEDHQGEAVHIFDQITLNLRSNRDQAYDEALALARERGYSLSVTGENTLRLTNPDSRRSYELTYDNEHRQLTDVRLFPRHAMELLGGEHRALLPPLYHNEHLGLEAIAPIKFFTPASRWTWYPTEFDGDDLFFGLVSGLEVELGYFSLAELEGVRDPLGLPIERDLYFEPTNLRELIALHERRG